MLTRVNDTESSIECLPNTDPADKGNDLVARKLINIREAELNSTGILPLSHDHVVEFLNGFQSSPQLSLDSNDSAIEQSDTEINHQLAFLSKINKMRAILQQTFNTYQDQFQIFLDNENLIDDFLFLYAFINEIFLVARKQPIHEKFLQKSRNLGNTYDHEFEN